MTDLTLILPLTRIPHPKPNPNLDPAPSPDPDPTPDPNAQLRKMLTDLIKGDHEEARQTYAPHDISYKVRGRVLRLGLAFRSESELGIGLGIPGARQTYAPHDISYKVRVKVGLAFSV